MVLSCIQQHGEREVKEISFDLNSERWKQDYPGIFEGVRSKVIYVMDWALMMITLYLL